MLPLGFSLSHAALRLFMTEVLDHTPFEATESAKALLQRGHYKSAMLFFIPWFCTGQT